MHDLSRILMITGSYLNERNTFLDKFIHHIQHGIRLIQLRQKELDENEYQILAKQIIVKSKGLGAKIILNTDMQTAIQLDADGVHLSSDVLMKMNKRPLSTNKIVFAACHNKEQLMHARSIGVDFVTLSPVLATKTHPDAVPLGWTRFSELCRSVDIPIYALGGLTENELDLALTHGAYGIAAISSLWNKIY